MHKINRAARGHLLHYLTPHSIASEAKVRAQAVALGRRVIVLPSQACWASRLPEFFLGTVVGSVRS